MKMEQVSSGEPGSPKGYFLKLKASLTILLGAGAQAPSFSGNHPRSFDLKGGISRNDENQDESWMRDQVGTLRTIVSKYLRIFWIWMYLLSRNTCSTISSLRNSWRL
ncbi:unnamed protein product [Caretta caretta]